MPPVNESTADLTAGQAEDCGAISSKWPAPSITVNRTSPPPRLAAASYSRPISTGTISSAAPCKSLTGTRAGSSSTGEASLYLSGTSSNDPPSSFAAAPPQRGPNFLKSVTPASETTPRSRSGARESRRAPRATPASRAASHNANCPPAE